jgi:hypothetical protein
VGLRTKWAGPTSVGQRTKWAGPTSVSLRTKWAGAAGTMARMRSYSATPAATNASSTGSDAAPMISFPITSGGSGGSGCALAVRALECLYVAYEDSEVAEKGWASALEQLENARWEAAAAGRGSLRVVDAGGLLSSTAVGSPHALVPSTALQIRRVENTSLATAALKLALSPISVAESGQPAGSQTATGTDKNAEGASWTMKVASMTAVKRRRRATATKRRCSWLCLDTTLQAVGLTRRLCALDRAAWCKAAMERCRRKCHRSTPSAGQE